MGKFALLVLQMKNVPRIVIYLFQLNFTQNGYSWNTPIDSDLATTRLDAFFLQLHHIAIANMIILLAMRPRQIWPAASHSSLEFAAAAVPGVQAEHGSTDEQHLAGLNILWSRPTELSRKGMMWYVCGESEARCQIRQTISLLIK